MTPTLVDIARETKTSVSTVSRVLSGGEVAQRISQETRQRVIDAANRLGYRPNLLARSLRTRKSFSIALLLPDISCGKCAKIAQLLEATLREQGYSLMLCNSGTDDRLEAEYLDMLPRKGIDGLIVVPHDASNERLAELARSPVAVVVLDRKIEGSPCVHSDFSQGADALADALEQTGVESVRLVTGDHHHARHQVLASRLTSRLEVVEKIELLNHDHAAQRSTEEDGSGFDAVVCTSSRIAEMYLSSRKGIDVTHPLACFDASNSLMSMPMPVMTCDQDLRGLADGVVELLLPQLRGLPLDRTQITLPMLVKTNHALALG